MNIDEKQLAFPFQVFEEELLNPIAGRQLTDLEALIAGLLLDASSERPIKTEEIIRLVADSALQTELTFRELKKIIRSLRRHHAFPILTRRSKPAGYWWCHSAAEMKEFAKLWQSQYLDEILTLSIMMKTNYPKLAGQMELFNRTGKR